MRLVLQITILLVLIPSTVSAVEKNPADDEAVRSSLKLLDAWVSSQQLYRGIPSISIGIIHDQDMLWAKSYGNENPKNKTPATSDSIYRIASNSKLFTSVSLMKLADEGKLDINDPVEKWLSEFKEFSSKFNEARKITIKHLISHTSGLPRESTEPYWTDGNFPEIDSVLSDLARQEAIFPPEKRFKYSNLALSLAGEIVARVSGMSYDDYVEKNIFTPLGMNSTGVNVLDKETKARLAIGYGRRMPDGSRQRMKYSDTHGMASATGLYTSVNDFSKFIKWQLRLREKSGVEILDADSLREMQRVHWLEPNWSSGRGLGFWLRKIKGGSFIGHGGAIHGYRTMTGIIPDAKLGIIVFTSADDGDPRLYVDQIIKVVVPEVRKAIKAKSTMAEVPAHWNKLEGTYRSAFGDTKVLIYKGKLVTMLATSSKLDPKSLTTLVPISEYEFRIKSKSGGGSPGEIARFELDKKGNVTRFYSGPNYADRVD